MIVYDKYPKDKLPPFKSNCFVFNEDLNRADRLILKNLVCDLFDLASIECHFSDEQWATIEEQAYINAKAKITAILLRKPTEYTPTLKYSEHIKMRINVSL